MSNERLEQAFRGFDVEHNGKISVKDLKIIFGGYNQSKEMIKDMFREADKNGDGAIDLAEFCNYMNEIKMKQKAFRSAFNNKSRR